MYVPATPGLSPRELLPGRSPRELAPFPLAAPGQLRYYRARNALYQLARSLPAVARGGSVIVAPRYHHGNEIAALRAAGASVRFYDVDRRLRPDLDQVDALLARGASALLVIHYLGWPQPIDAMVALAHAQGVPVIEDCALAFLSEPGGRALGRLGDWAVFCLYKTLPVPCGAVLVSNRPGAEPGPRAASTACGLPSLAARTADLAVSWLRGRSSTLGGGVAALKRGAGAGLTRLGVRRWPGGDDGFDLAGVDLRMPALSSWLLGRFDYAEIRRRRRANFVWLRDRLAGHGPVLLDELPTGVCPLFFPLLVEDKAGAARELAAGGVETIEFWNDGDPEAREAGSSVDYLRRHVLELPIHQDLGPAQLEHVAREVLRARAWRSGGRAGVGVDTRPAPPGPPSCAREGAA